jgi:hypothetical protein
LGSAAAHRYRALVKVPPLPSKGERISTDVDRHAATGV